MKKCFPNLFFVSLTVHFIDSSWRRQDKVLAVLEIPEQQQHTGEAIAALISSELQNNKLTTNKLICMVRDDASNMRRASTQLAVDRFWAYIWLDYIFFSVSNVPHIFYTLSFAEL